MNANYPNIEDIGPVAWRYGKCGLHGHLNPEGRKKFLGNKRTFKRRLRIKHEELIEERLELGTMEDGVFTLIYRPDGKPLTAGIISPTDRGSCWLEAWEDDWELMFPTLPYPKKGRTGESTEGAMLIWARGPTGFVGQILVTAPETHFHIPPWFVRSGQCSPYYWATAPSGQRILFAAKVTETLGNDLESPGIIEVHMGAKEYNEHVKPYLADQESDQDMVKQPPKASAPNPWPWLNPWGIALDWALAPCRIATGAMEIALEQQRAFSRAYMSLL